MVASMQGSLCLHSSFAFVSRAIHEDVVAYVCPESASPGKVLPVLMATKACTAFHLQGVEQRYNIQVDYIEDIGRLVDLSKFDKIFNCDIKL